MQKLWERVLGRSGVYEYLSAAFLYPNAEVLSTLQGNAEVVGRLLEWLGCADASSEVSSLASLISSLSVEEMQDEYTMSFGHTISTDCPPYEGEYGQAHIFHKSQSLADLGGFLRAFGLEGDPQLRDRMDHISVELEFMHFLTMKECHALRNRHGRSKVDVCRSAQRSFLSEHLGMWGCSFAGRLARLAEGGPYASLAGALDGFLRFEMASYGLSIGAEMPVAPGRKSDEDPDCYACPVADEVMEVNVI